MRFASVVVLAFYLIMGKRGTRADDKRENHDEVNQYIDSQY